MVHLNSPKKNEKEPTEEEADDNEPDILLIGSIHPSQALRAQGFDRHDPEQFAQLIGDFPGEQQHREYRYLTFAAGMTSDKEHVVMTVGDDRGYDTTRASRGELFSTHYAKDRALRNLTHPIDRRR